MDGLGVCQKLASLLDHQAIYKAHASTPQIGHDLGLRGACQSVRMLEPKFPLNRKAAVPTGCIHVEDLRKHIREAESLPPK